MSVVAPATFRQLAAVREYRMLFAADVLSLIGDQVAIVALAVLVYERSQSSFLTALTYSLAFLPWVIGGPVLAALADRLPRRRVLLVCSAAQFVLIGAAAIPGIPIPLLVLLVTFAAFLAPPFDAARGALLPDILDDDRYVLATSVSTLSHQVAVLLGFVAGGAVVALLSAEGALALDAVTFLLAALLIRVGVQERGPGGDASTGGPSIWQDTVAGIRLVAGHHEVRGLLLLVWLVSLYLIVPEALAAPFAAELGRGPQAVGILMAAAAGGVIVGSAIFARLVPPHRRLGAMRPLAILGAIPLLIVAARPDFLISVVCFIAAGACSASMIPARAAVMTTVTPEMRGRVFGLAAFGLALAQVIGILGAGAAAQVAPASAVIGISGVVGILSLLMLTPSSGARRKDKSDSVPANPSSLESSAT